MYYNLSNAPSWKSVMVTRKLPTAISGLEILCKNLWWCWNESAKALFKSIDYEIWHKSGHNPMEILDKVSLSRYEELANDESFLARLDAVMNEFKRYMAKKTERTEPSIGYFCMEYGLDSSLKIYSGGLGILAGDYLKETSDMNVNLVAVGLLYRYGYFSQRLTAQGNQVADYVPQDFLRIPAEPVLDGEQKWKTVKIPLPGREITARIWKVAVGRTDLYLLDTDFEANSPEDRQVTHHLYGGDWENRIKQEILLGIGGVRALRELGLNPTIYHYNEGHAAFAGLERLREFMEDKRKSYPEALELVRASSLYTTHTPVPAGHDSFPEEMIGRYLGYVPHRIGLDWRDFMALGKINPDNVEERFNMSVLACNLSQDVNGVSKLHGEVSRDIFAPMYPGYLPEELHVGYVTNGVHYPTWTAKEWKKIHSEVFGNDFKMHHYDKKCFEGIYKVSDDVIWNTRRALKSMLKDNIMERLSDPVFSSHYTPRQTVIIGERFREDVLTIGFARRFATYKRATLLFSDLDRLDAIVNNPDCPVQFVFSGKAHPADGMGQDLIKQIIDISKQDRFLGKIVFVPDYDISLAKRLVQGVDVWMNNPTRPQEASGTSGEKASMNGVMHFSVLDGWWVEGYKQNAGWALPLEATYDDNNYQNELDAATIYSLLETEIVPSYYALDGNGLPRIWISFIKNTIAQVASNFTTNRMLEDYCRQYYIPQTERFNLLSAEDGKVAKQIGLWKGMVRNEWNNIHLITSRHPDNSYVLSHDDPFKGELQIYLGALKPEDVGVEILFTTTDTRGRQHIQERFDMSLVAYDNNVATFSASLLPQRSGMYQVGTRIYPKNPLLPHRQDFPIVKWL